MADFLNRFADFQLYFRNYVFVTVLAVDQIEESLTCRTKCQTFLKQLFGLKKKNI